MRPVIGLILIFKISPAMLYPKAVIKQALKSMNLSGPVAILMLMSMKSKKFVSKLNLYMSLLIPVIGRLFLISTAFKQTR